ncbi:aquaporin [Rarobacter incanus]|uniref:Aquaporin Z n=1 Tax=Rarobacter incanus TaxID=153494 RepID=A0A542SRA5_9MICO|nr:aquaporin [Rarobacter incanus]TQK77142.1 aquaporin Z [Rarobacter incanus]
MTEQAATPTADAQEIPAPDVDTREPLAEAIFIASEETAPAPASSGIFARLGAEFFGTFLLVFVGVGAALFGAVLGMGQLGVALAFGIALMAGISAVGGVSGGHFNPAVTFGLTIAGRASWKDLLPYWGSQVLGGAFATLVLWAVTPNKVNVIDGISSTSRAELFRAASNGFGTHSPGFDSSAATQVAGYLSQGATTDQIKEAVEAGQVTLNPSMDISWANALIIEAIATAVFVAIILAVTDKRATIKFQPIVIGLTLSAVIAVAMPLTNASINPARSISSVLFAGGWTWGQLWVFVVAPLLGGAIAALFYRGFAAPRPEIVVIEEVAFDTEAPADEADAADVDAAADAADEADAADVDAAEGIEVDGTNADEAVASEDIVEVVDQELAAEEQDSSSEDGPAPKA